jgi:hypothetical protein
MMAMLAGFPGSLCWLDILTRYAGYAGWPCWPFWMAVYAGSVDWLNIIAMLPDWLLPLAFCAL